MTNYFDLPLNTELLVQGNLHKKCDLNMSIAHFIHLVNTSALGECAFDENFGTEVWNLDFDILKSPNQIKSMLKDAILDALKNNEKRLKDIRVEVQLNQEEISMKNAANSIKKRVDIKVIAKVIKTNEVFKYGEYFYLGPLSY